MQNNIDMQIEGKEGERERDKRYIYIERQIDRQRERERERESYIGVLYIMQQLSATYEVQFDP